MGKAQGPLALAGTFPFIPAGPTWPGSISVLLARAQRRRALLGVGVGLRRNGCDPSRFPESMRLRAPFCSAPFRMSYRCRSDHWRILAAGKPVSSPVSCRDFLHHLDLEITLGHQLLQPRVLCLKPPQPLAEILKAFDLT